MTKFFGGLTGGTSDEPRVGLFVDGPNVFREEFDVDLDDIREVASKEGQLVCKRLYLDEGAPPELLKAAEARGFEVVVTSGDVDVKLAVDVTQWVVDSHLDTLIIVSRDTDFKPAVELANRRGIRTVALAPGKHGRSDALRNAAHDELTLD